MTHVLLTGATGVLGHEVSATLAGAANVQLRLMSRSAATSTDSAKPRPPVRFSARRLIPYGAPARPDTLPPTSHWVRADLKSGEGVRAAVRDVDVIVHCATAFDNDTIGTRHLLEAARAAGVAHLVYISIVGCERIPLPYYRKKVAEEEAIKASGVPWSILRATQFHALIDLLLRGLCWLPGIVLLPGDLRFQPVAESDVGRRLAELALTTPTRTIQQMGGPQILTLDELARTWLAFRHRRRVVLPLYLPGKIAVGYRRGDNTCGLAQPHGEITWTQWLQTTYQESAEIEASAPQQAVERL